MENQSQPLEEQGKVGLLVIATKTKLIHICSKCSDGVSIEEEHIKEVDEYFGSIVSNKGGTDEDIRTCIGKARQAFPMLRPIQQYTAVITKTR